MDKLLLDNLGASWNSFEGSTATSVLRPQELSDYLSDKPHIRAVSSHLLRPPAPPDIDVLPILFLRDPLDRAFSVYCQERRTEPELPSTKAAHGSSFSEYVQWCLDHPQDGGVVILNYQVIHLTEASFRNGHIYMAKPNEDDLTSAIHYLSEIPFFGIVSKFDESIRRLCELAAAFGIPLAYSAIRENVTPDRATELDQRLEEIAAALPSELQHDFAAANDLDYRLYNWANKAMLRNNQVVDQT